MFQMALLVHAKLSNHGYTTNPIIIAISPLVSLMEDRVNFLPNLGIRAGSISDDKFVNIVYSSRSHLAKDEICCHLTKFDRNCCG